MTKQLFLSLLAGMLVIAPGCTKRTKIAPEQMSSEQREQQRRQDKTSGVALTTAGSVLTAGGTVASLAPMPLLGVHFGSGMAAGYATVFCTPLLGVVGLAACGAGVYMLVKGIDKLAHAKQIRRMQAVQGKLGREATEIIEDILEEPVLSEEQLEHDRTKYRTRGVALATIAPFGMVTGAVLTNLWMIKGPGTIAAGAIIFGASVYMLGQGIHDLAKAKTLRRIQMKQAAQQRKAERELAQQAQRA